MADSRDSEAGGQEGTITRQDFLRRAVATGTALALPGALTASARGATPQHKMRTAAGKSAPSGLLRVGSGGGSLTESLDPPQGRGDPQKLRITALYCGLFELNGQWKLVPRLAQSATPNKNATQWTFKIRENAYFHNGKPVTADDVLFTVQRLLAPATEGIGSARFEVVNMDATKALDSKTVLFVLEEPQPQFPLSTCGTGGSIVPVGFDPTNPIGAGPWMLESFQPGVQSTMKAFTKFFGQVPHCSQLIITDLTDDTARVDALLSGQVDAINDVPTTKAYSLKTTPGFKLLASPTGEQDFWYMHLDTPPFNDPRVVEAIKLALDRKQIVTEALNGFGIEAYDVYGRFDPCYDKSLIRDRNVAKAKQLLKQAGMSGLHLTMTTGDVGAAVLSASQIMLNGLAEAGITVTLNELPSGTLTSETPNFSFGAYSIPAQPFLWSAQTSDIVGVLPVENYTHWNSAAYTKLYTKASTTLNAKLRCTTIKQMAQMLFNQGGYLLPYYPDILGAYSDKLTGFLPDDERGVGLGAGHLEYVRFK